MKILLLIAAVVLALLVLALLVLVFVAGFILALLDRGRRGDSKFPGSDYE